MLLSLVLLSAAHLPHDDVRGIAVPEDFEEVGRAQALVRVDGRTGTALRWTLLETTDGGARWNLMPLPDSSIDPIQIVDWAGRPMLWAPQQALRLDGEQWVPLELPAGRINDARGGGTGMAIAGSEGLWWASSLESSWENLVPGASFVGVAVAADGSRIAGIGQDGQIYLGSAAELKPLLPLDVGTPVALALANVLYAATEEAIFVWVGGHWRPCAALPASPLTNGLVPVRLAARGPALVVGTGQNLAYSDDLCQSFRPEIPFSDPVAYGTNPGAVPSVVAAVTALWLGSHVTVLGSYRGAAVQSIRRGPFLRPRMWDGGFVRDLAWDSAAQLLYATNYGDALQRHSRDGLQSLSVEAMVGPDIYGRVLGWLAPDRLLYAGDLWGPLLTEDGGVSWQSADSPPGEILGLWRAGGQSWAYGPERGLFRSTEGQEWTRVEGAPTLVTSVGEGYLWGEEGVFVTTDDLTVSAVFLSETGDPREVVGPKGYVSALVSWPPGEGQRLLVGDRDGIALSDDGGESFERVLERPGGVLNLVEADDGTLFAVDVANLLWRSLDGGEGWTQLAIRLPPVQEIEVAPDFAERQLVVAGTMLGLFWSDDRGDSWHQAGHTDVLRADQTSSLEKFSPTGTASLVEDVLILSPGDGVAPWTRGSSVTVEGRGEARLGVELDGEPLAEIQVGELLALPGEGWRKLRIEVIEGQVGLTRVSMPFEGEPIPLPEATPVEEAPGCGCGDGGAAGLLLPFLFWGRRRR